MSKPLGKPTADGPFSDGVFGPGGATARAALYARVSTSDQHTDGQMAALRKYARRRGWTVAAAVEEVGSGAAVRPRRDALLAMARRREIDVVIVWRLDRWGRSLADLVGTLQDLTAVGVGFVSVTEALDLTTPAGRALAGMLAVFAEFERDILRERVRAGIARARAKGKHLGRPPTAARMKGEMERLAAEGLSRRAIARKLNVGRASVDRHLGGNERCPAQ